MRREFTSYAAVVFLAAFLWIGLSGERAAADVYRYVQTGLAATLANVVGAPERNPRDLMVNGQPLQFTPYQSQRSVAEVTAEWLSALDADTRPAQGEHDPIMSELAGAANLLITPKVSRIGDDFAVVVRFFDGDGKAALAFLENGAALDPSDVAARPIPGVAVSIRRTPGSGTTEVLMTRFENVVASLSAFTANSDQRRLPSILRPPPGATVLSDIGDRDSNHTSRTVISSGALSIAAWRDARSHMLSHAGFVVEDKVSSRNGSLALHARREAVEIDVLYTNGANAGEVVEVIAIRQLLFQGKMP